MRGESLRKSRGELLTKLLVCEFKRGTAVYHPCQYPLKARPEDYRCCGKRVERSIDSAEILRGGDMLCYGLIQMTGPSILRAKALTMASKKSCVGQ